MVLFSQRANFFFNPSNSPCIFQMKMFRQSHHAPVKQLLRKCEGVREMDQFHGFQSVNFISSTIMENDQGKYSYSVSFPAYGKNNNKYGFMINKCQKVQKSSRLLSLIHVVAASVLNKLFYPHFHSFQRHQHTPMMCMKSNYLICLIS